MRKYFFISFVLLFAMQLAACNTKSIKVDGFSAPESVTSDGTYFYVSNVGEELKPMDRDGDGYISRLSEDGRVLDSRYISGLNAPKGMVVEGGVLYVNDIDHLKGFSVVDGKKVVDLDFSGEGTSFLNGITVIGKKQLLVSAMDTGVLYVVDVQDSPSFTRLECEVDLLGPNGLSFDSKTGTVYLCSFGKNHEPNGIVGKGHIESTEFIFEKIYPVGGLYDGMVFYDGSIIFSDWVAFKKEGVLIKEDVMTGEHTILDIGEKIAGPADFYLDEKGKRLWIPMMMENKVLIVGM